MQSAELDIQVTKRIHTSLLLHREMAMCKEVRHKVAISVWTSGRLDVLARQSPDRTCF